MSNELSINGTIGVNLKNIMLRKRSKASNDLNGSVYVNFRNRKATLGGGGGWGWSRVAAPGPTPAPAGKSSGTLRSEGLGIRCLVWGRVTVRVQRGDTLASYTFVKVSVLKVHCDKVLLEKN